MWRRQISLIGILVGVLLLEVTIIPWLWSSLRVDLFLGMVLGLAIYSPFPQGFFFVLLAAPVLQAFTGARAGYLPFAYVLAYVIIDLMKGFIFLENVVVQCLLGLLFSLAILFTAGLFVRLDVLQEGWVPILLGAGITAGICPVLVACVRMIWSGYEA